MGESKEIAGVARTLLGALRIAMGWLFLWSFFDSLFGLGFSTCRLEDGSISTGCDAAMVNGGSPTWGFLNFATGGSRTAGLIDWLAPSAPDAINFADVLYMLGLLGVGLSLTFGVAVRLGGLSGAAMMVLVYLASSVWPEFNPLVDEHIIYILVFLIAAASPALFSAYSLRSRWMAIPAVENSKLLQ